MLFKDNESKDIAIIGSTIIGICCLGMVICFGYALVLIY